MIRHSLLLLGIAASGVVLAADPQFVEVAAARNLNFTTSYGVDFEGIPGSEMMQRNMGNGMAVGDYDNDGDLDVYVLGQFTHTNKLFRNDLDLGAPNFTEVSAAAGVDMDGMSRAAAFADLDNDGWKDLIVVNDDDGGDVYPYSAIFRNNADGTFTNVTDTSNFRAVGPDPRRVGGRRLRRRWAARHLRHQLVPRNRGRYPAVARTERHVPQSRRVRLRGRDRPRRPQDPRPGQLPADPARLHRGFAPGSLHRHRPHVGRVLQQPRRRHLRRGHRDRRRDTHRQRHGRRRRRHRRRPRPGHLRHQHHRPPTSSSARLKATCSTSTNGTRWAT